jgi:hypothetical protein
MLETIKSGLQETTAIDLPPDLEELRQKLPPLVSVRRGMEITDVRSTSTFYKRIREGRYIALRDGSRTKIVTSSLLNDMAAMPRIDLDKTTWFRRRASLGGRKRSENLKNGG